MPFKTFAIALIVPTLQLGGCTTEVPITATSTTTTYTMDRPDDTGPEPVTLTVTPRTEEDN